MNDVSELKTGSIFTLNNDPSIYLVVRVIDEDPDDVYYECYHELSAQRGYYTEFYLRSIGIVVL